WWYPRQPTAIITTAKPTATRPTQVMVSQEVSPPSRAGSHRPVEPCPRVVPGPTDIDTDSVSNQGPGLIHLTNVCQASHGPDRVRYVGSARPGAVPGSSDLRRFSAVRLVRDPTRGRQPRAAPAPSSTAM